MAIARKIKKESFEEHRNKRKAEFNELKKKIAEDRSILSKKKEVAEQLYENPYGEKFSSDQIARVSQPKSKTLKCFYLLTTFCSF